MAKKPKRMGNVINKDFGTGYAGNVWDRGFVLPALTTCQGGGREPMVVRIWGRKSLRSDGSIRTNGDK